MFWLQAVGIYALKTNVVMGKTVLLYAWEGITDLSIVQHGFKQGALLVVCRPDTLGS